MNNNQKIWFVQIQGTKEGPFSVKDLKRDRRVTPDTLVWRKGFNLWLPIRKVPELKDLFKDEFALPTLHDTLKKAKALPGKETLVLDSQKDLPPLLILLLIILFILIFIIYTHSKEVY